MALVEETACCALSHLRAGNADTLERINAAIEEAGTDFGWYEPRRARIPSALFAVTQAHEKGLAKRLKSLGFRRVFTFPRRPALSPGTLTFWLRDYEPKGKKTKFRILPRG